MGGGPPARLGEWAARYLGHYFTCPPSRMHGWLVGRLERLHEERGRRIAIIAPRGGAKTTWVSKALPLYCAVHRLEPYILLLSETADQAEKNLAAIKEELESNGALVRDYPQRAGRGLVWKASRIESRGGVCIEALGIGAKIRGRTFGPHRPTLVIADDLENDQAVESPRLRERTFQWFQRAVLPAGTRQTNVFVLGTALHREDLLQRLKRTAGWESRTFASILAEPQRRDLWRQWESLYTQAECPEREAEALAYYEAHRAEMEAGAVVLWPEREPLYELMCLRAVMGEAAFRAEKQGEPTSTRTSEWPDAYFGPSLWFDRWPELRLRVIALDPSKGTSETSDYSAFVFGGLGTDGRLYVDADLARRDTAEIVEQGIALAQRLRPDAIAVETNQFQEMLKDELERVSRERGLLLPVYGLTNRISKRVRIRTLTALLRGGQIAVSSTSAGGALLVQQLREFPMGRHDDGPDALEMFVRMVRHLVSEEGSDVPADVVRA